MTVDVETIVVGAGIIGVAVARALAMQGQEVVVIEAEPGPGAHASSRNSGVVHAGIYYPPGSLKARLCIEGKGRLYRYCEQTNVPVRAIGKLVVATDADELARLHDLAANASDCGMRDFEILDQAAVVAREPELRAVGALWSPSTGIVDVHALMQRLIADAQNTNVAFAWNATAVSVTPANGHLVVATATDTIRSRRLVNAAGHGALPLAVTHCARTGAPLPEQHLVKGTYFRLQGGCPFSHLVYPMPASASLGVHLTLDTNGEARFGPDQECVDELDYTVDVGRATAFATAIRRYWPDLREENLLPDYAGVRVRTQPRGPSDFVVHGPADHGVPGLINLFGIESPGLTASLALADEVARRLTEC